MKKRNTKDIWHGLYDFQLIETRRSQSVLKVIQENSLIRRILKERKPVLVSKQYKHVVTHQNIHAKFILIDDVQGSYTERGLKFYSKQQITRLPKPTLIQRFLIDHNIL